MSVGEFAQAVAGCVVGLLIVDLLVYVWRRR